MLRIKYCIILLLLTLCFVDEPTAASGQPNDNKPSKHTIDSILESENLISLGSTHATFYSSGFDVRAKTLQRLVDDCAAYYEHGIIKKKFSIHLYILNRDDWEKLPVKLPYGLPFYDPDYDILVIAAEKNALAKLNGVKDFPETPDSVLTDFDYQPLHELGHYFFFTLNNINKEKWFNEFLATYFLICYIKDRKLAPGLQKELLADYPVDHRNLEDFQNLYVAVGPKNYHWYQCKFAQLGFKLYPQFKTKLITDVLGSYSHGGEKSDGITLLKKMSPGIINEWLNEMQ
ncbi:MAG: hypothetical protein QM764_09270 [Chitinophagaceae bacterium]